MSDIKKKLKTAGDLMPPILQENLSNHSEYVNRLDNIRLILSERFPSLSIQQAISQDSVPFLHIWKPISKSSGVQGMPFLPCFHIIVTLSVGDDNENNLSHERVMVLFQLHSFHGKVLKENVIDLDKCNANTDYTLVQNMARDKIQLCHGVEEIDRDRFKQFVKLCKLPLLHKIRSVFLIEQFMGSVVFRSRLCEFALESSRNEITHTENDILLRCHECSAFQYRLTPSPLDEYSFSNVTKEKREQTQNIFERVYYKTSVSDMEAMVVLHEVRKMYENPLRNGNNIKSKKKGDTNLPALDHVSAKGDVLIKAEPEDLLCRPNNLLNTAEAMDEEGPFSQVETSGNIKTNKTVYDNNALVDHEKYEAQQHIKEEIMVEENSLGQVDENKVRENVDGLDGEYPIFVNDNKSDNIVQSHKPTFRKKRGRPRKYHSRLDYLNSLEKRKERKKKEIPSTMEVFDETCQICLYKFKNESCHRKDQERHEQALSDLKQPVFCPICNENIFTKYLLTSHFEECHSDQNLTCCCECLELIPKGNNRLRQHILKTHHTAAVSLVCPDCGLKCAGNVQFQIHMAIKHSSEKSFMCQHCGIGFAHSKRLQVHLRRNHQPRDLQCPHCDKKFETRDQAIRHLVVHTGLKPYKCVQCQYSSYRQCNVMSVHFVKSHGRKGTQSDVLTDIAERDMMSEIAVAEVDEMLKNRKLNLKKELSTIDT